MRKPTLPSNNAFWTISANWNRLRVLLLHVAVMLAAGLVTSNVARAANVFSYTATSAPGSTPDGVDQSSSPVNVWNIGQQPGVGGGGGSGAYYGTSGGFFTGWEIWSSGPNTVPGDGGWIAATNIFPGGALSVGQRVSINFNPRGSYGGEIGVALLNGSGEAITFGTFGNEPNPSYPYTGIGYFYSDAGSSYVSAGGMGYQYEQSFNVAFIITGPNTYTATAGSDSWSGTFSGSLVGIKVYNHGAGDNSDVGFNNLQVETGAPPQITQVYPGNFLFASNRISFHVTSTGASVATSNIHLVVNGTDVSSTCQFSGASPNISVLYNGLSSNVWAYTASITVTDQVGKVASTTMNFDTVQPAFVWEAEDYDFTNGQYINNPLLSSTAQPNSYYGVTGTLGVDFSGNGNNGPNLYRANDHAGIDFANESARQKFLTAQQTDAGVQDYQVSYINPGNWMNYTRNYPAGTYNIYARFAGGAGATTVALSNVVSGTLLGNFQFTGGGWSVWNYASLVDTNGNLLSFTFDGSPQTLSATLLSGGDNMNFFMLVPAVPGLPALSNFSPANGTVLATNNTFSFTANSTATINNSGIHLYVNGADVSSGLVISGSSTSKNVSWPLLQSNSFYTVVMAVTNASGAGVSRTIQFDTMSTANFYVKLVDFDFNGGLYDTSGNGLVPYAYQGDSLPGDTQGAVTNIDYSHDATTGSFPYRGPTGLAQEVTGDAPLPGYTSGSDYDVSYFNPGDWANYTRSYPPGNYWVYARLAGGAGTGVAYLDKVIGGLGTASQTTQRLGKWSANPGGWQNWVWVPLMDTNLGAPVVVSLSGSTNTLRVTSGGGVNANYFMLVPAQGINISAAMSGSNLNISFPTQAGSSCRVFYTTNLTSGVWNLLSTVPGDGTVKSASDPATGSQRFYKVTSP